jgi:hypothetical protein
MHLAIGAICFLFTENLGGRLDIRPEMFYDGDSDILRSFSSARFGFRFVSASGYVFV